MNVSKLFSMGSEICICFLLLVLPAVHSGKSEPGTTFIRSEILAEYYLLTWEVDLVRENVTFEVKAHTTGYVGFGVNAIAGMKGADIIIGGVYDNGTSYFSDRHGLGSFLPPEDERQDWYLLNAQEADGWTMLKFTRALYTCDVDQDILFTNDTFRVLFSIGQSDEFVHHVERGAKSVLLLSPPNPPVDVSTFKSWKVTVNTEIPAEDTTYWVTIHKSPKFSRKSHMVGFEVQIDNEVTEKYTHHMVLHRCFPFNGANLTEVLGPWVGHPGGASDDPAIIGIRGYCPIFLYVWAKGGSPLILPEDVGIPIGDGSEEEYFLLEVHYDNPRIDVGIKYDTGVTIYYTNELREHDGGALYTGIDVLPGQIIPPNVTNFVHVGHCSSECTTRELPADGINVFNVLLHSHLNGRKLRLRHFRDGTELPWIANDGNYDFDYQENRALTKEVKVLPGDHLTVECTYDTTWHNPPSAAYGGESTRHEMCQAFVLYYPLLKNLDLCASYYDPYDAVLNALGIEQIDMSSSFSYPVVLAPEEMKGLTLMEALNTKVNWTTGRVQNLQHQMQWAIQKGICHSYTNPGDSFMDTDYPNVTTYEPVFTCAEGKRSH